MDNCTNRYTTDLLAFIETYDLIDILRVVHTGKKLFTRIQRNPTVMSRIDHWLISSQLCNIVNEAQVLPGFKSDHSIIKLSFNKKDIKRGSGFWKFNCKLLRDKTFVDLINKKLSELKEETIQLEDKGIRWDYIKCKLRGHILSYSIRQSKLRREYKNKIQSDLLEYQNQLTNKLDEHVLDQYQHCKEELEKLEELETQGAILRAKAKWAEAGEKILETF